MKRAHLIVLHNAHVCPQRLKVVRFLRGRFFIVLGMIIRAKQPLIGKITRGQFFHRFYPRSLQMFHSKDRETTMDLCCGLNQLSERLR